ncbi:MAG: GNAT family N-acetyltransferase [Alphaproteobacteria bacterium]|nr:GNAT family N-acetyltransferase [Alphaproteobacteria bacterium]
MTEVPTLSTARLLLRPHRPNDLDASLTLWSDPEVTRFIGGRPFTREEVWGRLMRYAGQWAWLGFGMWAVEERATGAMIGDVGFLHVKRDMSPAHEDIPETAWALRPDAHGKGYATEAVRGALHWGDAHFGRARSWCMIEPENTPSLRVAAHCGYVETARATYHGAAMIVLMR